MFNQPLPDSRGITLLESLTALTILATVLSVSISSFQWLYEKNQTNSVINSLSHAINFSRYYAAMSRVTVTLCATDNKKSCSKKWTANHMIFIDRNENAKIDATDQLLYHFQAPPAGSQLTWHAFQNKYYLKMSAIGIPNQNGHFTYCPPSKNRKHAQQIIITKTGKVRLGKDKDGDGIIEDTEGKPLHC